MLALEYQRRIQVSTTKKTARLEASLRRDRDLAEGGADRVRELVEEMQPIFAALGLKLQAFATVRLFVEAAGRDAATVEMARVAAPRAARRWRPTPARPPTSAPSERSERHWSKIDSMSKPVSPTVTVDAERAHPLRTGKIRLTRGTASEIARGVGVRPSEAKFAQKLFRLLNPTSSKTATFKFAVTGKPGRSSNK